MTITTVWQKTLTDQSSGWNGSSVRQIHRTAGAAGNQVRVTLQAPTAGQTAFSHLSIGLQSANYNTAATPVELKFGGASGASLAANSADLVSDWAALDVASGQALVTVADNSSVSNYMIGTYYGGDGIAYNFAGPTWNQSAPSGSFTTYSTTNYTIKKIEVQSADPRPASGDETSPLTWPNNVNTTVQRDKRGTPQNIAYYDNDDTLTLGPISDPRITTIMQTPVNLFRPHIFSDFNEMALDPKWQATFAGNGALTFHDGVADIATGTTNGGGCRLSMPNVPAFIVPGMRLYFYLTTPVSGAIDLKFGVAGGSQYAQFSRVEDGAASNYHAQTNIGATLDTDCGQVGDSVRRIFAIDFNPHTLTMDYYIGSGGGELVKLASHAATNTAQQGAVFVDFKSRSAANRNLLLDVVYAVLIR
jgi:hypothetical protein